MTLLDRRIYGLENEYAVLHRPTAQEQLTPDQAARLLFRIFTEENRISQGATNHFLENGSRFYLDVGSHPEYATPECDNLLDLITHDKAGELLLCELVEKAGERVSQYEAPGPLHVFKNNTDSVGNTYGCHENYLVSRGTDFSRLTASLIPFLVTRQLICGSGKVVTHRQAGSVYSVSPRASHICESTGQASTHARPIINTRDEPHADANRYRRLHVLVGDSSMSETTAMLKVGSTDLVLRMIEAGIRLRPCGFSSPVRAIHEISLDCTGTHRLQTSDGRSVNALEVQEDYFSKALEFADAEGLNDGPVAAVLDLWGRVLDAVRTQDFAGVCTEVDWVIKRRLIDRYRTRNGLDLSDPRISQIDLAYHDIHRGRGLFYLLQEKGLARRFTSDAAIALARNQPPQTTRARLRGDFVRAARAHQRDVTVDWSKLKLNDSACSQVICDEPFRSVDSRVDGLIARIERHRATPRVLERW